jgi:hypothetical protein
VSRLKNVSEVSSEVFSTKSVKRSLLRATPLNVKDFPGRQG